MRSRLVVWYNTKCPVCDGGIRWQRNRLVRAARAGAIEFRDINLEPAALAGFGAGIEYVRRRPPERGYSPVRFCLRAGCHWR